MLIAHLSDSHIRDAADVRAFEHQLDRITAGGADHLVISGDLLDRWRPRLLTAALGALTSRGLLTAAKTTIIHGITTSRRAAVTRAAAPTCRAWCSARGTCPR